MDTGGIALVWGPPRSGTTWLYNVAREMLDTAGIPAGSWVHGHEPPRPGDFQALVVKAHQAHTIEVIEELEDLTHVHLVAIFRSPHAAFQSLLRTQSAPRAELLEWLRRDVESIVDALPRIPDAVVCREEWIADRAPEVVAALAAWIHIPLGPEGSAAIAERFARHRVRSSVHGLAQRHGWTDSFVHYDLDSHWHANHIAPDDHDPAEITADEAAEMTDLAATIDRITADYSLLGAVRELPVAASARPISHDYVNALAPADGARRRVSALLRRLR